MYKINVTQPILNLDGSPMLEQFDKVEDGKVVPTFEAITLRAVCCAVLIRELEAFKNESAMKMIERNQLAERIYSNDIVELSAEDVVYIKSRIEKSTFGARIYAQCARMLENKSSI